jgi:hypothetical protein
MSVQEYHPAGVQVYPNSASHRQTDNHPVTRTRLQQIEAAAKSAQPRRRAVHRLMTQVELDLNGHAKIFSSNGF